MEMFIDEAQCGASHLFIPIFSWLVTRILTLILSISELDIV